MVETKHSLKICMLVLASTISVLVPQACLGLGETRTKTAAQDTIEPPQPARKLTWKEKHWHETPKKPSSGPAESKVLLQPHQVLDKAPVREISEETRQLLEKDLPKGSKLNIIQGEVRVWDTNNIDKIVEKCVDEHVARTPEAQKLEQQVKHYRTLRMRAVAKARDSLQFTTGYQGINPSKRMGELVLSEKAKVRDATTAEYERQRYVDKIHSQVIASMMEIAQGLGTEDKERREAIITSGVKSLDGLVGEEQSKAAYQALKTWLGTKQVSENALKAPTWTTMERETKLQTILDAALVKDPVITEIRYRVYKYANAGKIKTSSMSALYTTMNTVNLVAPGFTVPLLAEATLNGVVMATGGSEDNKIEKELVLDKRIQSRLKVLNQEATLALDNYRFAMVTHNAPLLAFSQAVVSEMSTEQIAGKVLPTPVDTAAPKVVPQIQTSKAGNEDDG